MFKVFLAPRAGKTLDRLSGELQKVLYSELKILSVNPFLHRKTKKIRGSKFGYHLRLRCWRILFAIFRKEKRIEVVDIFQRKEKNDYAKQGLDLNRQER